MDMSGEAPRIRETEHARRRRLERGIDKKLDLETALQYGTPIRCHYGTAFKYKDIVYVVEWQRTMIREITCYAMPIGLKHVKISADAIKAHDEARSKLLEDPGVWQSNTVIVVDTSGSMREADIWGARTRLHAVWMSVALDFVAHRLESGFAGPHNVISILSMGESSESIVETEPTSWVLYNRLVEIYNRNIVRPYGHGNYIPSLTAAEQILTQNKSASCGLALCFISDGRPSDRVGGSHEAIINTVESLGKKFGRRLTFTAVGVSGKSDDFDYLQAMVDAAKDYGVQATFELPSMTSAALGDVLTLTATSLTKSQTEMTDLATQRQRNVRDVLRESTRKANEEQVQSVSTDDYFLYSADEVERFVYKEWHDEDGRRQHSYDRAPLQHIGATFVAMNKASFGEGAERFAFRFFEIDADGETVVGRPLVAKESRLVLEGGEKGRERFVRTFCQTQQLARRIAEEFNEKLDELRVVDNATPRVSFLDCSVYQLDDVNLGKQSVLVEEKLDSSAWHKWNANNGFIEGMRTNPTFTHDKMRKAYDHLAKIDLNAITEEDDEEEEDDSSSTEEEVELKPSSRSKKFGASEVAQAFSHFSYYATGKKRLICDLQGVFDERENVLKFSDPVIHYSNPLKGDRKSVHGRTDLGRKGMAMFFDTHYESGCCGHLCRLVTGGFRKRRYDRRRQPPRIVDVKTDA